MIRQDSLRSSVLSGVIWFYMYEHINHIRSYQYIIVYTCNISNYIYIHIIIYKYTLYSGILYIYIIIYTYVYIYIILVSSPHRNDHPLRPGIKGTRCPQTKSCGSSFNWRLPGKAVEGEPANDKSRDGGWASRFGVWKCLEQSRSIRSFCLIWNMTRLTNFARSTCKPWRTSNVVGIWDEECSTHQHYPMVGNLAGTQCPSCFCLWLWLLLMLLSVLFHSVFRNLGSEIYKNYVQWRNTEQGWVNEILCLLS